MGRLRTTVNLKGARPVLVLKALGVTVELLWFPISRLIGGIEDMVCVGEWLGEGGLGGGDVR